MLCRKKIVDPRFEPSSADAKMLLTPGPGRRRSQVDQEEICIRWQATLRNHLIACLKDPGHFCPHTQKTILNHHNNAGGTRSTRAELDPVRLVLLCAQGGV
jgi:hypothetical protein